MAAYDLAQWNDLFVATAGAAAALAGLVFVAVSLNIERILQMKGVPERGLQTVLLLLGAVVVSILGLVPQRTNSFAIESIVTGGALVLWLVGSAPATLDGAREHPMWIASRTITIAPGSVAYVVAGASILTRSGGGLAWVVVGIIGAVVGAVVNAWVLLVEILR